MKHNKIQKKNEKVIQEKIKNEAQQNTIKNEKVIQEKENKYSYLES
jgi:hypothetical protein